MEYLVFDPILFLPLVAMITNIILGIYIYNKDTSEKLNKLFCLFSLAVALWSFGNFLHTFVVLNYETFIASFSQILETIHFGNVFTTIGSAFQAAFLLNFLVVFTKNENKIKPGLLFSGLYFPAFLFTGIEFINPIYLNTITWPYWYALVIYIIVFTAIGLIICYKYKIKTSDTQIKKQATFIIYAILIPLVGGIIFELIPRILYSPITSLTTSFTTIMAVIIGYTIVKYKLMIPLKERLKITEEKFKKLFNTIPDSITLISNEGAIIEANDKAIENLNLPKDKLLGKKIDTIMTKKDDEPILKAIKKSLHTNKTNEFEARYEDHYYQYIFVPTKTLNKKNNVLVIKRDITEKKNAEIQMKEANKIIHSMNEILEQKVEEKTQKISDLLKEKEHFILQLNHDLKTPLGPILNLLKVMHSKEKNPEMQEILTVIQKNADYMKNLVVKSLEIARLDSQNAASKLSTIYIKKTFDTYFDNKKYLIDSKKITIENNIKKDCTIKANEYELEILISNLIENAINYNKKNGKIIINAVKKNDSIEVSITDTGIGMTEKQIKNAFEEFYKADESRHHLDSTGLGLSICKKIVERFNGKIWIESKGLEKGTTVFFSIPQTKQ